MPSPQATAHRDDLWKCCSPQSNACRQPVPVHGSPPPTGDHRPRLHCCQVSTSKASWSTPAESPWSEITKRRRQQLPTRRVFPTLSPEPFGLGHAQCCKLPHSIGLVVACLAQANGQAATAQDSDQWRAVSVMVWLYRPPLNCGEQQRKDVGGNAPETEGGSFRHPVPGTSGPIDTEAIKDRESPTPQHH